MNVTVLILCKLCSSVLAIWKMELWCIIFNILVILPALISAKIQLEIVQNGTDFELKVHGRDGTLITQNELAIFGLNGDILKNCTQKYLGGYPTDIFLTKPTPWDLFKKHSWAETQRILTPVFGKLNHFTNKGVLIKSTKVQNNELHQTIYKGNITHDIKNLKTKWWGNLALPDVKIDASIKKGNDAKNYTARTYTFSSNIDIFVEPGQEIFIGLFAKVIKINATVVFKASLKGNMILNYEKAFRGHHFYAPTIEDILQDCGIDNNLNITADLELTFYEEPRVEIKDEHRRLIVQNGDYDF